MKRAKAGARLDGRNALETQTICRIFRVQAGPGARSGCVQQDAGVEGCPIGGEHEDEGRFAEDEYERCDATASVTTG